MTQAYRTNRAVEILESVEERTEQIIELLPHADAEQRQELYDAYVSLSRAARAIEEWLENLV